MIQLTSFAAWARARRMRLFLLLVLAASPILLAPAGFVSVLQAGGVHYAAPEAKGNGDCSGWDHACTLQTALSGAVSGDEVWIRTGVHKPTNDPLERTATFTLTSGVAVYGGFAGTEAARSERDVATNVTVLSGDIDDNDTVDAYGVVTNTAGITGTNSYHVVTGSGTDRTAILDGVTVTAGRADGDTTAIARGGGMVNANGHLTVSQVTFSGNAARFGGGMYTGGSNSLLSQVTFSGNQASDYGGAIYNRVSSPTLSNVLIGDNKAATYGGGIYNYRFSSPSLDNVIFRGNTATYGGGMFNRDQSNPALNDVTFSSNSADSGGGMFNYEYSSPTLSDVTFSGNSAGGGGGMLNLDYSSPTLSGVTFSDNTATVSGGAILNNNAAPALRNVLLTGNTAGDGGGLYNTNGSNPRLVNVTVSGNTAGNGGGLYNINSSNPALDNAIVWGNTAGNGAQIYNDASTPVIAASDVEGSGGSGGWDGALGTDGGGNIDADPRFADAAGGDLRLSAGSPAIDSGDNSAIPAGVTTDRDGNARIVNGVVDMGAYENQYRRFFAAPAGSGNCSSWADACSLQTALDRASGGDEVWVQAGVHKPTSNPLAHTATFALKSGVAVYGGFWGTETARSQRRVTTNVTVLSGDIDDNDAVDAYGVVTDTAGITGTNSYHVVTGSGTNSTAVLDGVTVTAGQATGSSPHTSGGGMYSYGGSPTLNNVTFSGNLANIGGGMHNSNRSNPALSNVTFSGNFAWGGTGGGMQNVNFSSPVLVNVTFNGNEASLAGGGMDNNYHSNPTVTNVIFGGNRSGSHGGGMRNHDYSSPTLSNVVFSGNRAQYGGGMYNSVDGTPTLSNVTFSDNNATYGGGVANYVCSPRLRNVILWGNSAPSGPQIYNDSSAPAIAYSNVEGSGGSGGWDSSLGSDGGNNIDANPLFVDVAGGDLRLSLGSPAVDSGDNSAIPGGVTTDLDGYRRIVNGVVDMGAYEYPYRRFARPAARGAGDCSSWSNACTLQEALAGAVSGAEIWVQRGVHKPTTNPLDRHATFILKDEVAIYGGFAGTETARQERDVATQVTVLSGDIDGNDSTSPDGVVLNVANISGQNSFHVITGSGVTRTALLDGVTVTAGQANGNGETFRGGGMYNYGGSPTLRNVTFSGNLGIIGGGMANYYGSSPAVENGLFWANVASSGGGAYGGGMANYNDSSPQLTNVTISRNSATSGGGGMTNYNGSNPLLRNVIMWDNTAGIYGAEITNNTSTPIISASDIAGSGGSGGWDGALGTDGGGNLDADPRFVDAASGNLALRPGSPAVDGGAAGACPAGDVRGVPRPQGGGCDMGAYERVVLVLAGTPLGSNMVELSWTATGYGPYDLWHSSQPYGGYSSLAGGLAGPSHTRNVDGMTFFELYAEGIGEASNRIGVVPFALVRGQ